MAAVALEQIVRRPAMHPTNHRCLAEQIVLHLQAARPTNRRLVELTVVRLQAAIAPMSWHYQVSPPIVPAIAVQLVPDPANKPGQNRYVPVAPEPDWHGSIVGMAKRLADQPAPERSC